MKQFIFNENDNIDLNEIAKELFMNKDDPASIYYKRHLVRPRINWFRLILHVFILTIAFIIAINIFLQIGIKPILSIIITCAILFFYILLSMKKILIFLVHIYQRFSPDSIRMKCRFEPSCSQYMIMALEKYGVLKGLKLGLKRLRKCKIGNGGFDFP